ncbi:MAG: DUF3298 and DUF4163 domain-containing protein [Erysipelotrichales bacterium]|nr:DUF3298 and DUF4163 domain-containing protein [Erysipelotrichales bacterium]
MDELTCLKRFRIHEDYYYAGVKIVSCTIFYPQFTGHNPALDSLNKKYYLQAVKKEDYCRHVLYPNAVQAFLQNSKAFPYEFITTITITLQTNEIISFYQQEYVYTGGANGQTTRISQTVNTLTGQIKQLCDFFQNKKNCIPCIKRNIIKQINTSKDPTIYFHNYPDLIEKSFQSQNFYLTSEGVVIFFSLYDIAPHSTGIPTFLIPYSQC